MRIVIFLFDGVTALDAVGPYESLARIATSEVRFVSREAGPVRTGDGFLALNADAQFDDIGEADLLIVPGGNVRGIRAVLGDPATLDWLRVIDATTRWTASVCTGSLFLDAAGLLTGRRASTHWRARAMLANYSPERVTIDGKYWTSAGVSAGIDLGLLLCAEIAGREVAEAIELSMQYDPQPPFGTGDFTSAATAERVAIIERELRR